MKIIINGQEVDAGGGGWNASKPIMQSTTLPVSDWDSDALTISVQVEGVQPDTTSQLIIPTPSESSQEAYYSAGIKCIHQAENALTFEANKLPEMDIDIYITILEVNYGDT